MVGRSSFSGTKVSQKSCVPVFCSRRRYNDSMSDAANPNGVLRKCAKLACVLTLSFGLYACSLVPARMVILWLDHWGMIPYTPVNNALNKFYAPVLWMDDHIPVIRDAGDLVDNKTRPLLP
jgi:hypothetical protein